MKRSKPGKIVIISSPSGGGKTSICRRLLTHTRKAAGWSFSISYTTRARRKGERDGREYYFVDDAAFDRLAKKNAFAEHFKVHLYKYGTPKAPLQKVRRYGGVMVLDVDLQGAARLRKSFPEAISIFVMPPSVKALKERLRQRGTETKAQLSVRYKNARHEMKTFVKQGFDYVVINKELDQAVTEVLAIITAHHCRLDKCDMEQIRRIIG